MCAMNSDFILAHNLATVGCQDAWFIGFSWLVSASLIYGAARTTIETSSDNSGVYNTRLSNVLQVTTSMTIPILADVWKPSLLVHDSHVFEHYQEIVSQYPEYTSLYISISLAAMYTGNLVCALSSAEHHGAISKESIGNLGNGINLVLLTVVYWGFCTTDNGHLARSMLDVSLEASRSLFSA